MAEMELKITERNCYWKKEEERKRTNKGGLLGTMGIEAFDLDRLLTQLKRDRGMSIHPHM